MNATASPVLETPLDRDEAARILVRTHRETVPELRRVFRVLGDESEGSTEPIKLLEENPNTFPGEILPIHLGAAPPEAPVPSIVMEVTEAEFERVLAGDLRLPYGWKLGSAVEDTA